jgi:UDP-N-acetylmuramoyl-L-alanyl-D-glutamate--2,6-diaminopimelate ligase
MRSLSRPTLEALLSAIPVLGVRGSTDLEVSGVTVDSREAGEGDVFVALAGLKTDGNRFIADAVRRGACAVVSEKPPLEIEATWIQTSAIREAPGRLAARFHGNPSERIRLVGITGTNGKTTTAYLLDGVIGRLAPPSAMLGTVIRRIGATASPARHTTPEAPLVQSFLAQAVAAGCRFGVLEVSSHGLALGRIEGTRFEVAVFTNLTRDHLDFHRDMEDYFAAKRRLFENYLRPEATAVIGLDDAFGRRLAESRAGPLLTYGFSEDAALRVEEFTATFEGLGIRFRENGVERRLESPLLGRHNVLNLLAAFAAARALGFDAEEVIAVLAEQGGAPGRFEKVATGRPFQVIVDYAHTDDALRNLLEATLALPHRRVITVFGCGGDRDRSKRPLMGAVAARLSDSVVLTSDNPRTEDPLAILAEIERGARGRQARAEVRVEPDRRKAIALALSLAGPEDVVLISGKGHETYQIVGERVLHFDDREVVREILGAGRQGSATSS